MQFAYAPAARRGAQVGEVQMTTRGSKIRRRKILPMPADRGRQPQSELVGGGEPGWVIDFPAKPRAMKRRTRFGKLVRPDEIASLSADEKKFICSQILMDRSDDAPKLDSVCHALPSDLVARALIELVLSNALTDDELSATLYLLMTDPTPEWRRTTVAENCPHDDETNDEAS
jgi:hypothetical protein